MDNFGIPLDIEQEQIKQQIITSCKQMEQEEERKNTVKNKINEMLNSEEYIALSFPINEETQRGTLQFDGTIREGLDGGYSNAYIGISTELDTGTSSMNINSENMLVHDKSNCKSSKQFVFLVPKEHLEVNNASSKFTINFTAQNPEAPFSMKGQGTIKNKISQKGADTFCLE